MRSEQERKRRARETSEQRELRLARRREQQRERRAQETLASTPGRFFSFTLGPAWSRG